MEPLRCELLSSGLALNLDIPRGGMYMQYGAPTIQAALGVNLARAQALRIADLEVAEVASDAIPTRHLDRRAHIHSQPVGHVDHNVAHRRLQARIRKLSTRRQPRDNPACARLRAHSAFDRPKTNAPTARLNLRRARNVLDLDIPAACLRL